MAPPPGSTNDRPRQDSRSQLFNEDRGGGTYGEGNPGPAGEYRDGAFAVLPRLDKPGLAQLKDFLKDWNSRFPRYAMTPVDEDPAEVVYRDQSCGQAQNRATS